MSKCFNNIGHEIYSGIAGTIAEFTTRLIIRAGQKYRFYFDDSQQNAIKKKTKNFLMEIIENAKMQ